MQRQRSAFSLILTPRRLYEQLSLNIWPNGQKRLVHRKLKKNRQGIELITKIRQKFKLRSVSQKGNTSR